MRNVAFDLAARVRNNTTISTYERATGIKILDFITEKAPELLNEADNLPQKVDGNNLEISIDLINAVLSWDKKVRKLKAIEFGFLLALAEGRKVLNEHNKTIASWNIERAKKCGFKSNI